MSALTIQDLLQHLGHNLEIAWYGGEYPDNATIECVDCGEVLYSIDAGEKKDSWIDARIETPPKHEDPFEHPYLVAVTTRYGNGVSSRSVFIGFYDGMWIDDLYDEIEFSDTLGECVVTQWMVANIPDPLP